MEDTTSQGHDAANPASNATHSETGSEHAVFPPFDTIHFPGQIFWLVVFFALLYVLMSKWILPRMGKILAHREDHINADIARAGALKSETEAALAAYEKSLADARAEARTLSLENQARVTAEMDAERHAADSKLSLAVADAEAKINATRTRALTEITSVASEAAMAIVEQLAGAKVSAAAANQAVASLKRQSV